MAANKTLKTYRSGHHPQFRAVLARFQGELPFVISRHELHPPILYTRILPLFWQIDQELSDGYSIWLPKRGVKCHDKRFIEEVSLIGKQLVDQLGDFHLFVRMNQYRCIFPLALRKQWVFDASCYSYSPPPPFEIVKSSFQHCFDSLTQKNAISR